MSSEVMIFGLKVIGFFLIVLMLFVLFEYFFPYTGKKKKFVGIDVSGSLRDETFETIKNILSAMVHERITVILFDYNIVAVYEEFNAFDRLELVGRGGSDFTEMIDYVNKKSKGRRCDLILFTDGFGKWKQPNANVDIGVFYTDKDFEKIKGAKWEFLIIDGQ